MKLKKKVIVTLIKTIQQRQTHLIPKSLSADTTNKFTNDNWQIIISEIAQPVFKGIIKSCVAVVNKFFGAVPAADLLLP